MSITASTNEFIQTPDAMSVLTHAETFRLGQTSRVGALAHKSSLESEGIILEFPSPYRVDRYPLEIAQDIVQPIQIQYADRPAKRLRLNFDHLSVFGLMEGRFAFQCQHHSPICRVFKKQAHQRGDTDAQA